MLENTKNPPSEELAELSTLHDKKQFAELEEVCTELIKKYPKSFVILNLLGVALCELGKLTEAIEVFDRTIDLNINLVESYYNRGIVQHRAGQFKQAIESYKNATRLDSKHVKSLYNSGVALTSVGQLDDAINVYSKVIHLDPNNAEAHGNKGFCLKRQGKIELSLQSFNQAIQLRPDYAEALNNRGNAFKELGQLTRALQDLDRAIAVEPNYAIAYNSRGSALQSLGLMSSAIESFSKAIRLQPDFTSAFSNLLLTLNYVPQIDSSKKNALARQFGEVVAGKVKGCCSTIKDIETPEKLRVGMVSGDLNNHPVGYFLENVLFSFDSHRIELFAYPTSRKFDELSGRIKRKFAAWKPIYNKTDFEAAELIAADHIHILIDLSGHTADNRLPMFAYKPSPVQVSWLGYFATTGMKEIDFVIADPYIAPQEDGSQFIEDIWHLPETRWCFTPPDNLEVSELPALTNNYITFGCFNTSMKITKNVMKVWARILIAVPNSKLLLKAKQFIDREVGKRLVRQFIRLGIDEARILIEDPENRHNYLAAYCKVDIALDTFPFTGGATSVEALWMGVPFITLYGGSLVSRQGVGILENVQLQEWIATDEDDYVEKAIFFASNFDQLSATRRNLRNQIMKSPLFDAPRFARNFEDSLWKMWNQFVANLEKKS